MKDHSDYFDSATRCLIAYQYIEEALKQVLTRLEVLVYFRIRQFTPYDPKSRLASIRDAAMGRLIDMLTAYCDDADLIAELREIKKQRDDLAHQAFLRVTEQDSQAIIEARVDDLERKNSHAHAILMRIGERWNGLDALLNKITAEQKDSAGSGSASVQP
jgi:hypothetical protein